jgi:hypothetical protein
MDIKALYQRFRAWQIEPYQFQCKSKKTHQCFNCGNTFDGDYCPVCGQNYEKGPVGWVSDEKAHKPLFGLLEPGSIGSFVLQILSRPGYMISDFLKGRNQVTGSPIGVLYYIAAATLIVLSLTGKDGSAWFESMDGNLGLYGVCLQWMVEHIDWAVLFQALLLVFPVWVLFRFAPKHSHHKLLEGFFIQAFMTSIVLICIMLRALISDWLILLIPICNFITYRQLFGYGFWGTLWRTLLSMGIVMYVFAVISMMCLCLAGRYPSTHSSGEIVAMSVVLIALGIGLVWFGWWISKKTEHKN